MDAAWGNGELPQPGEVKPCQKNTSDVARPLLESYAAFFTSGLSGLSYLYGLPRPAIASVIRAIRLVFKDKQFLRRLFAKLCR